MATKITPENLSAEIEKILGEYADDADKTLQEVTKEVAKAGAKALQSASGIFNGKKYAKGWVAHKETTSRTFVQYVIWNKNQPGLPHLLEYGHAKRAGGRVAGETHIAPVEEQLIEEFINKVEQRL